MRRDRKAVRAFTLIELLVVVAIIAVLVAILLPALASARETSQSVVCQSQQRQLGVGFQIYANTYDDFIASRRGTSGPLWYEYLHPCFPVMGERGKGRLIVCPSNPKAPIMPGDTTVTESNYAQPQTIGMVFRYPLFLSSGDAEAWGRHPFRFADVVAPSTKIGLIDYSDAAGQPDILVVAIFNGYWYYQQQIADCHKGGANALYLDGHVGHDSWTEFAAPANVWKFYPDVE